MVEVQIREIICYLKSLKKGFDKDLFQSKINDLACIVDTFSLEYSDFHTLFKIWLNLNIPITKWKSFAACLIPPNGMEERTVDYTFRWILANYGQQSNFSRIGFVLDWFTAAMECNYIDTLTLDPGYDLFYSMLSYIALTRHALKLVYTLTKPTDVTRRRVLDLFDMAENRKGKGNTFRPLLVLLGLFKSYKPEFVPEDVPAIPINMVFQKLDPGLIERFKRSQERRNIMRIEKHNLLWPSIMHGRSKKVDPLIPSMEFINIGAKQYDQKQTLKNYFDFSEAESLVQHCVRIGVSRPARLRALLCNETGLTLLAVASHADHVFFSNDLHHLLTNNFLEVSPHSYTEKQNLLRRLALFQRTMMQGIPVITAFLGNYLPFWNEKDYFSEILDLVEWISVDSADNLDYILRPLAKIYHRSQPLEQCAILKSLSTMYANLVYATTRKNQYFLSNSALQVNYEAPLQKLATELSEMCKKGLQANPNDMRVVYSSLWSSERVVLAESRYKMRAQALPALITLATPLLTKSAVLIDKIAHIIILYKKMLTRMKANNDHEDEEYSLQVETIRLYAADLISCLYNEDVFRRRGDGVVFRKLGQQTVEKLEYLIPQIDDKLSIRNHVAFAPYIYINPDDCCDADLSNKILFDTVVYQEFTYLWKFLKKSYL